MPRPVGRRSRTVGVVGLNAENRDVAECGLQFTGDFRRTNLETRRPAKMIFRRDDQVRGGQIDGVGTVDRLVALVRGSSDEGNMRLTSGDEQPAGGMAASNLAIKCRLRLRFGGG